MDVTDQPAKKSRWVHIALFASLALNLLVIGVIVGARAHDARQHGGPPELVRDLSFGPFTDALLPEDRMALRRSFMSHAADFRRDRSEMRTDFADLLGVLRADPFDPARLSDVMSRQEARNAARLALGRQLLSDRIAEMSPEQRAAFADRLETSLSRRAKRGADQEPSRRP